MKVTTRIKKALAKEGSRASGKKIRRCGSCNPGTGVLVVVVDENNKEKERTGRFQQEEESGTVNDPAVNRRKGRTHDDRQQANGGQKRQDVRMRCKS